MDPQETLNFWKQIPHVMKYFRETENPTATLPQNFMQGFLEVSRRTLLNSALQQCLLPVFSRVAIDDGHLSLYIDHSNPFKPFLF